MQHHAGGGEKGVHTLLRAQIPTLPAWGGCICHDCTNMLKSAVEVRMYNILISYCNVVKGNIKNTAYNLGLVSKFSDPPPHYNCWSL
jgi:hypothetical protein